MRWKSQNDKTKHMFKESNGVKFYATKTVLYSLYKQGDITIVLDNDALFSKCFVLFPNTLAVQTFVHTLQIEHQMCLLKHVTN